MISSIDMDNINEEGLTNIEKIIMIISNEVDQQRINDYIVEKMKKKL